MEREVSQPKVVSIDGYDYLINHQNPEIAWDIGIELTKMIGSPAATMAGADENNAGDMLSGAVNSLLSKIDSKTSWTLIKKILSSVEVQGETSGERRKSQLNEAAIKIHFQGKMGSLIKVAGSVIAYTHEDFFKAMMDGIADLIAKSQSR